MGCRPRNAVWSGVQSLRKTQQKTRLPFNAVMSTCAAALVGPFLATGLPTQCLDGAAVAMDQLPARTTPSPTMERRVDLAFSRSQWVWVRTGNCWDDGFPSLQPLCRNPLLIGL